MILLGAGTLLAPWTLVGAASAAEDPAPEVIEVTGIVRDFRERTVEGGHPDFEKRPEYGFSLYSGNIATALGLDRKPVFTGAGQRLTAQFEDAQSRPICRTLFDSSLGDQAGTLAQACTGGIESAASFDQWYRDTAGVNLSAPLTLALVRQENGHYVFDDTTDTHFGDGGFSQLGGFFPVDDRLYGNSPGLPDHNFHFTFELHLEFRYDADTDQYFRFVGDDDVFVYINDQLVIDLNGVHSAKEQYVDMDRLGLADGEDYRIDFFFAERHRTQSNFRIETNVIVSTWGLPSTTSAFD
jgi:fibro-slime domain-containing protein